MQKPNASQWNKGCIGSPCKILAWLICVNFIHIGSRFLMEDGLILCGPEFLRCNIGTWGFLIVITVDLSSLIIEKAWRPCVSAMLLIIRTAFTIFFFFFFYYHLQYHTRPSDGLKGMQYNTT